MTKKALLWTLPVLLLVVAALYTWHYISAYKEPIKVGILHSLTGVMAMSESQLADASLMAIEEINREGGLLGRRIQPIVGDGRSDWPTFASEAERMITREKVCAIFGGYTSASRKEVKQVVETYNNLLFYPVPYEGVEESSNIVYNGASPNQLYVPAIKWCFDKLGKRFFLIGSDYIWPRTVHILIKDLITALRGEILGEEYLLVGSRDVREAVEKIVLTRPDVIVSTIVGETNIPFYDELRKAGITSAQIPTMAFGISEVELAQMEPPRLAGNYSCWSYFQSVNTEANRKFVSRFRARYGKDRVVNDSIEAGYFGVRIWAQAVLEAGGTETDDVRHALADQSYEAPGGIVFIDGDNLHTWKMVRIGRIRGDGQFDIVWSSRKPVRPVPYPIYRSKSEWNQLVEDFHANWGGAWSNPGK